MRDFLNVLFKRKIQILVFFCVAVCAVGMGTLLIEPKYEATSQVLVKVGRENLYVSQVRSSGGRSPIINLDPEGQIKAEIEILRSRSLAEQVVEFFGPTVIYKDINQKRRSLLRDLFLRPRPYQSPVKEAVLSFQRGLKVEGLSKATVIKVKFRHKDPQMAANVVNTLVSFYLDRHLQVHKSPKKYKFFKEQSEILENKLRGAEGKLQAFKKQHNITSLSEERSLLLKQAADLSASLNQTLSQEVETETRISELRQQLAATPETIPQGEEIDHNPYLISSLEARLVELELKEKELITKRTEQSRLVKNVRNEIIMVREKLAEQETKRYGKSRYGPSATYQRLQDEVLRNRAELKALRAKRQTQTSQLDYYQGKLQKHNLIEAEFRELQQKVEVDRRNYRLYLSKFEEARICDAMDTEKIANISLIEAAQPPLNPVSPKVMLNMVVGVFLSGFVSLGLAFLREFLDDSLERPEDVEEFLQLPVLASLPELKN